MKTKLYRTITLVLAIIMLLGVTPAFAAKDGPKLTPEDWDNHNYVSVPYDFNVAADDNAYIPFSNYWHYGDRTSASSKSDTWELIDGVCYAGIYDLNGQKLKARGIDFEKRLLDNMAMSIFEGNTHLKTVIVDASCCDNIFTNAPALKTVIYLHSGIWNDWTHSSTGYIEPNFPRNAVIITGLVDGEMSISTGEECIGRTVYKSRSEFIEAVRPILASAHLTDKAWGMIPKEFGGEISVDLLKNYIISDWAKTEVTNALNIGIIVPPKSNFEKTDLCKTTIKGFAANTIINTYEAICKATGKSTDYPTTIPETFGPNKSALAINKGYCLGIFKGDGSTWRYNGKTYSNFGDYDKLTREQMAAMLVRLVKACGKTLPTGTMPFTDAMSDWAKPEISACYNAGLIKGTSATTFGALDNVTGEQVVVLCYRAYNYLTTH